jgi:sodium-dependent phosphate cotransporter
MSNRDVSITSVPQVTTGELSTGGKVVSWIAVIVALYVLVGAVGLMGRGFRLLGHDVAEQLFSFAVNPLVGASVGVLATVLIQSSTAVTSMIVAAVGAGAVPVALAIPMILGSNVGTTATGTFVALGFAGNPTEFRRALAGSSIHDFYNLLSILIFLPLEVLFHPLERLSGTLAHALQDTVLPDPSNVDVVRAATRPVVDTVVAGTSHLPGPWAGIVTMLLGIGLILAAVQVLSRLLKVLMVGRARAALMQAVYHGPALAMATGAGATVLTQSSTVTQSILVPFVGVGVLTPGQLYPITVGSNLGTTLTALLAAFAFDGEDSLVALQIALVHVLYNVLSVIVIFVLPYLRPVPLWCAERLAAIASVHKAVLAAYVVMVFLVLPALIIVLGVLATHRAV